MFFRSDDINGRDSLALQLDIPRIVGPFNTVHARCRLRQITCELEGIITSFRIELDKFDLIFSRLKIFDLVIDIEETQTFAPVFSFMFHDFDHVVLDLDISCDLSRAAVEAGIHMLECKHTNSIVCVLDAILLR
jgi:hypothetical protein